MVNQIKNYHEVLKEKMDTYAHLAYKISRQFPKEELFGVTSQLRRSSLSVVLNYIEGYARVKEKVHKNFLEISYGSLKESRYLLGFCDTEGFITDTEEYKKAIALSEEIGAMLWGILRKL